MTRSFFTVALALGLASAAFAVKPGQWRHGSEAVFAKGNHDKTLVSSHGQVMLSLFSNTFPSLPDGTVLLLDEPEMALSQSNQRRTLKMLQELVDQKKFRIVAATHSPILLGAAETYVINLDRHINRNIIHDDFGVHGASTIQ